MDEPSGAQPSSEAFKDETRVGLVKSPSNLLARSSFLNWPPRTTESQLAELSVQAISYALSSGLVYLPPSQLPKPQPQVLKLTVERRALVPATAVHAPFTLYPSPYPRRLFEQAQRLQHVYNVLYARIALDTDFLDYVMGTETGVGSVDAFMGELWKGWKQLRTDGLIQPYQLGLFRNDYILHMPNGEKPVLKQVEFNTISAAFGGLTGRVAALHRYLYSATKYYHTSPRLCPENFPPNESASGLAGGLAAAHAAYGNSRARILFVVQPDERNVFDQRIIEQELVEKFQIRVIRKTFDQLSGDAILDPGTLTLRVACPPFLHAQGSIEIAVVYFRAGYSPTEYSSPTHFFTRFLLERSRAIKCPSLALHLAGSKKVQEVLTRPGILEYFMCNKVKWGENIYAPEIVQEVRNTFMEMWSLDTGEDLQTPDIASIMEETENFAVRRAYEIASQLVLKPQREGGGNNVYRAAIPPFLQSLPAHERPAWIAMKLISPPPGLGNYLLKPGTYNWDGLPAVKALVVSELGIYGWALFGHPSVPIQEEEAGWLVRTKNQDSNEGGVATGFSALDSVLLVNDIC